MNQITSIFLVRSSIFGSLCSWIFNF